MNDLERDLRTLLETKADLAHVTPRPEPRVLKRARRRQLGTVLGASIGLVGVLAIAIVTIDSLRRSEPVTPALPSTITRSMNGIEITFPETWHLIDPDAAGLNGPEPTPDLPRLVLALASSDPGVDPVAAFVCPGLAVESAPTFVMTIQEQPLALAGPASAPWPVQLESMDFAGDQCHPGWELLRASWTTAGRTFQSTVGFDPDVSDADRDALYAALASMTFEPIAEGGVASVVLATGTAGGEDWSFIASKQQDGLTLSLDAESSGSGSGGFLAMPTDIQAFALVLGTGASRETVIYGAVPANLWRVQAIPASASAPADHTDVLDIPDTIDARLDAFLIVAPGEGPWDLFVLDTAGEVVLSGRVGGETRPVETPSPVLFRGRTNDCLWTLSGWLEEPDRHVLRLSTREGDLLVELVAWIGDDASPIQLASYDCPTDGTDAILVFGMASDQVLDVRWTDPLGDDGGPPECIARGPTGSCIFLADFSGPGEAIALDAEGNEIARVPYG